MHLVASALALLAIYAGMKLLALTKKESLGNLFKYMSWFIVLAGFIILICVGVHSLRQCRDHWMGKDRMEMGCSDHSMMGCHKMMMNDGCCSGMMRDGCRGSMMNNGCCGGMMSDGCCGGHEDSEFKEGKCDMKDMKDMKGMKDKMDTVVIKRK